MQKNCTDARSHRARRGTAASAKAAAEASRKTTIMMSFMLVLVRVKLVVEELLEIYRCVICSSLLLLAMTR